MGVVSNTINPVVPTKARGVPDGIFDCFSQFTGMAGFPVTRIYMGIVDNHTSAHHFVGTAGGRDVASWSPSYP